MAISKNSPTGSSEYWKKAHETAKEVRTWPEWKRSISSSGDSASREASVKSNSVSKPLKP